jgi:hypothetical protein
MRNRVLEIAAALIGVAIVVVVYLDRIPSEGERAPAPNASPPVPVPPAATKVPAPPPRQTPAGAAIDPRSESQATADAQELAEAREGWEAASANLEAVESELKVLDQRFDDKEAALAELEAQGIDTEALEEEMLIFLDGIVEEYDALETRLAEAEAAELAAAERLARLRGDLPGVEDPDC